MDIRGHQIATLKETLDTWLQDIFVVFSSIIEPKGGKQTPLNKIKIKALLNKMDSMVDLKLQLLKKEIKILHLPIELDSDLITKNDYTGNTPKIIWNIFCIGL